MALDPGGVTAAVSPPSSGRSSPAPRAAKRTIEEGLYKADKGLRRFGATIERALSSWEISPQEWADYIAFLGRLLKAIQTHPKDTPLLPHSDDVAYKLAQCLDPALPSGVHQKALEVYDYIFSTFGRTYVADHLHEFLPGLSAVLSFASLSVRPAIYTLYESYVLRLSSHDLRPVLKSLILSLLPGLEDDASEDFERAFRIVETLEYLFATSHGSHRSEYDRDGYFWQSLFLAVISNPSRRQGALNFLSRKLPNFRPVDGKSNNGTQGINSQTTSQLSPEAESVIAPEPGLLIRCFVCGLSDPQLLIQRGFLDLLVVNMPLNSPLLQEKIENKDLDLLVSAAMHVLLRREMSLNRRLWSWFLGPETKQDTAEEQSSSKSAAKEQAGDGQDATQFTYFTSFGKVALERCQMAMFKHDTQNAVQKARPFRICLSLMDRWEIGGSIVPQIFLPAMESVYRYSLTAPAGDTAEVVRSASLFFDGVEASLIWADFLSLLRDSLTQPQDTGKLKMFTWIIQNFNVKDEEMLVVHIPLAIAYILALSQEVPSNEGERDKYLATLEIIPNLLDMVPERAFTSSSKKPGGNTRPASLPDHRMIMRRLEGFYLPTDQASSVPYSGILLSDILFQLSASLLLAAAHGGAEGLFCRAAWILLALKSKSSATPDLKTAGLSRAMFRAIQGAQSDQRLLPFPALSSILSLLIAFGPGQRQLSVITIAEFAEIEHALVSQFWAYLSPSRPKYHVEAVKSIWQLQDLLFPDDCLQSSLTTFMRCSEGDTSTWSHDSTEAVRRFAVLWGHAVAAAPSSTSGQPRKASGTPSVLDSKQSQRRQDVLHEPLMIVLDMLDNRDPGSTDAVKSWLHSLSSLRNIFDIHFDMLLPCMELETFTSQSAKQSSDRHRRDRLRQFEYVLGHFEKILDAATNWTWQCLNDVATSEKGDTSTSGLGVLAERCCQCLCDDAYASIGLEQRAMDLLKILLQAPNSASLKSLELDTRLVNRLINWLSEDRSDKQDSMLRLLTLALKLRTIDDTTNPHTDTRPGSSLGSRKVSATVYQSSPKSSTTSLLTTPPTQLLHCLQLGFSSRSSRSHLNEWLTFLSNILPVFAEAILTNLIPLVETLCSELEKAHKDLQSLAKATGNELVNAPEPAISVLLEALEILLGRAHKYLAEESVPELSPKLPSQPRSLLGGVTTGIFKAEGPPSKTAQTNSRLTVVLAYQDAVRISSTLWTWANRHSSDPDLDKSSSATASYSALRVRNRARHLLERSFAVEPLESLEVIISVWCNSTDPVQAAASLDLLHIMHGMKPRIVVSTTIAALYSRTNTNTLAAAQQSCQTTELTALDITMFLSAYLQSTEDDAMDEIWTDCMTFLRDVLANPLPYRQVLPALLSIILLLAQKVENTNFGEQRKMRRDLGDVFLRLLTATFTAIPSGAMEVEGQGPESAVGHKSTSLAGVLKQVTENIEAILEGSDRTITAINNIATSLIAPVFHSKTFPTNVSSDVLALLLQMSKKASTAKSWKKELTDAFNDPRLLLSSTDHMMVAWFPVLRQWCLHDKERVPELLSRLTPPSSAGIMFGVGASAARLEADRRTQLNLRRLCLLLLSSTEDSFATQLRPVEEKLIELFEASPASSPSSTVKAELFMVCRALVLSTGALHLSSLWPLFNHNMQVAMMSLMPSAAGANAITNLSLLQACKLLDLLVAASPDEFQLHEWLYVSDTIDAVYQPSDWTPAAMSDQIAESLNSEDHDEMTSPVTPTIISSAVAGRRQPLLDNRGLPNKDDIKAMTREDFARVVLKPFFSQLSLHAYEGFYSMEVPDLNACRRNLLEDLLDLSTIVE